MYMWQGCQLLGSGRCSLEEVDAPHTKRLSEIHVTCACTRVCVLSIKVTDNGFSHSKNATDCVVAWDSRQRFRKRQADTSPERLADLGSPTLR